MFLPNFIRKRLKQREMTGFYKKFVKTGDLCFDIGANRGERTDCFLKLGAKAIAVEPQSSCYRLLEKKYSHNDRVTVLKFAAGSAEGEAYMMICDEADECSTLSPGFMAAHSSLHWGSKEKVQVTTLENLCRQYGVPGFCKIDVEGYESQVLLGLKTPIPYICFEFNKALLEDTIKSLEIINSLGNYRCNFIRYEIMSLALDEWLPVKEFLERLDELITPGILTGEIVVKQVH